ncbi:hypothetical protein M5D96_004194 [Drosophila gunungcola]|uniref:Uncharacterized protein n=1 Tax=Drosophila gunungcola TaxID=103775 RepID=A0A9P9YTN1_9MUSC|nr:hypothetical protein M5D96_004194 [Drosophila gunungcola]
MEKIKNQLGIIYKFFGQRCLRAKDEPKAFSCFPQALEAVSIFCLE